MPTGITLPPFLRPTSRSEATRRQLPSQNRTTGSTLNHACEISLKPIVTIPPLIMLVKYTPPSIVPVIQNANYYWSNIKD